MEAVRVIGLTGGIGTGKTTVARILAAMGVPVIAADEVAREVVEPGQPAWQEIRAAFGPSVFARDGRIDRAALARVVFADEAARRRLEAITHPRIRARMAERVEALRRAGAPAVVLDVPLLFESGMDASGMFDEIWVVAASPETQLRRVAQRDGRGEEEARARMRAQWPVAAKVPRADRVIWNEGDLAELRARVEAAWRAFAESGGPPRGRGRGGATASGGPAGPGRGGV